MPRADIPRRGLAIATTAPVTAVNTGFDHCVFCTREDQPGALVETGRYYIMPDRFPLVAGHTLVISRAHTRCYAVADGELIREVEAAAYRVRDFLRLSYGNDALIVENGVEGQTVFHAHLHLIPVRPSVHALPPDLVDHPDVVAVRDWNEVKGHFSRDGAYRYIEFAEARYVIRPRSTVLPALHRLIAGATGAVWGGSGWIKSASDHDVELLRRLWIEKGG